MIAGSRDCSASRRFRSRWSWKPDGRVTYARMGQFGNQVLVDSVRAVLDQPVIEPSVQSFEVPSVGEVPAGR